MTDEDKGNCFKEEEKGRMKKGGNLQAWASDSLLYKFLIYENYAIFFYNFAMSPSFPSTLFVIWKKYVNSKRTKRRRV